MNSYSNIYKTLKEHKKELEQNYGVDVLGVFGSYVRSEQTKKSDLDILVEFNRPIGLLRFVSLKNYLTELTGTSVDLVMKSSLKPTIGKLVLKEVKYI
jgi:uncharacterized protein